MACFCLARMFVATTFGGSIGTSIAANAASCSAFCFSAARFIRSYCASERASNAARSRAAAVMIFEAAFCPCLYLFNVFSSTEALRFLLSPAMLTVRKHGSAVSVSFYFDARDATVTR